MADELIILSLTALAVMIVAVGAWIADKVLNPQAASKPPTRKPGEGAASS